jgi:hypothetical protein
MKFHYLILIGMTLCLLWVALFFIIMNHPEILGGLKYSGDEYGFMVGLFILFENISNSPLWWQLIFWVLSFTWPMFFVGIAELSYAKDQEQIKLDKLEKELKRPLK